MSITLRSDNRTIFRDSPYGALIDNYPSASSSVVLNTTEGFEMNDFVVIGTLGTGNAELLQVKNSNHTTGEIDFFGWADKAQASTDNTHLYLPVPRVVKAGQTVTGYVGQTPTVRGTASIATDQAATEIILSGAGIVGLVQGDLVEVNDITKYAHSESSRVTRVPFDKVQFFYTYGPQVPTPVPEITVVTRQNASTTETQTTTLTDPPTTTYTKPDDPSYIKTVDFTPPIIFDNAQILCNPTPIQVTGIYTVFLDNAHLTGFGWFAFYNSFTKVYSPLSNYIPYSGFEDNSVKSIFESFDSSLNNKELKLITMPDRFTWLNEAFNMMTNELNLGNWEYNASEDLNINILPGITDYLLPKDFGDLLEISDEQKRKIFHYNATWSQDSTRSEVKYIIRGRYIVFKPSPIQPTIFTLSYLRHAGRLSELSDVVNLPDNMHYNIKDYMLFRAYRKLGNLSESTNSLAIFQKAIDNMKIYAIKRDNGLDSWGIDISQTV